MCLIERNRKSILRTKQTFYLTRTDHHKFSPHHLFLDYTTQVFVRVALWTRRLLTTLSGPRSNRPCKQRKIMLKMRTIIRGIMLILGTRISTLVQSTATQILLTRVLRITSLIPHLITHCILIINELLLVQLLLRLSINPISATRASLIRPQMERKAPNMVMPLLIIVPCLVLVSSVRVTCSDLSSRSTMPRQSTHPSLTLP